MISHYPGQVTNGERLRPRFMSARVRSERAPYPLTARAESQSAPPGLTRSG